MNQQNSVVVQELFFSPPGRVDIIPLTLQTDYGLPLLPQCSMSKTKPSQSDQRLSYRTDIRCLIRPISESGLLRRDDARSNGHIRRNLQLLLDIELIDANGTVFSVPDADGLAKSDIKNIDKVLEDIREMMEHDLSHQLSPVIHATLHGGDHSHTILYIVESIESLKPYHEGDTLIHPFLVTFAI